MDKLERFHYPTDESTSKSAAADLKFSPVMFSYNLDFHIFHLSSPFSAILRQNIDALSCLRRKCICLHSNKIVVVGSKQSLSTYFTSRLLVHVHCRCMVNQVDHHVDNIN